MNRFVVDASVAVKWFVPEVQSIQASRLFDTESVLAAPDCLGIEVANTLWKKVRRGELEKNKALEILAGLAALPIEVFPSNALLPSALQLALSLDRTVCDSLYLALALSLDVVLVTADEKFASAVRATPYFGHVQVLAEN